MTAIKAGGQFETVAPDDFEGLRQELINLRVTVNKALAALDARITKLGG